MMAKPFATFFFILCMVWLGSIFVTSDPNLRIERTCKPITWVGKLVGSVASASNTGNESSINGGFYPVVQGCKTVVWKLFYQDDVNANDARLKEIEAKIQAREQFLKNKKLGGSQDEESPL